MQYKVEKSTRFRTNPTRIEQRVEYTFYGSAYTPSSYFNKNLKDFSLIEEDLKGIGIENLTLVSLTDKERDLIPVEYLNSVKSLNLWEVNCIDEFMNNFPLAREIYVNPYVVYTKNEDREVKLWNLSITPKLEKLVIRCPEIRDLSPLKDSNISHFEIEGGEFYLGDKIPYKIYTDFSVFATMKNLKILKLWIEPISDNYNNLVALSNLVDLEEIYLPTNYFTHNQFAYLKSKLKNTRGLNLFTSERNRGLDRYEYLKLGSEFPIKFIPLEEEEIDKEMQEFDKLVAKYSLTKTPPKF